MRAPQTIAATIAACLVVLSAAAPSRADEGMWTFNQFPTDAVAKKYGFKPTPEWLDKVRLGSVRLAQGCSASFVSPDGLVMTNHHCAHECIQQLSTKQKDFVAAGFTARAQKDEVKCPALEVNQLVLITDVTARMAAATAGKNGAAFSDAQKAEKAKIEGECTSGDDVRCDVVTLYQGGRYDLYKYKRYQDVRLVFAPEFQIAFFGGDPDNFMFPRYDLDVSFVRVYEGGKPAATPNHFPFAKSSLKQGDLTFVAGNPGSTSRESTVAELAFERDVLAPARLVRLAEMRGTLAQFATKGKEQARVANKTLFSVENSYKAWKGAHGALVSDNLVASKAKAEADFVAAVKDPAKKKAAQQSLQRIAAATVVFRDLYTPYENLEIGRGFASELFPIARTLVRAGDELTKPNEQRLDEYRDGNLPAVKQELLSTAPIYPDFEIETLTFGLTKLREQLGPDDPVVKKILGKKAPRTLATEAVKGSKLGDPKVRQKLLDGGKAAIDASKDPMIVLARLVDPDARAVRKRYEDEVKSVVEKEHEVLAKLKFEALGTSIYPDATFTPRLSYGAVQGWRSRGKEVVPFTTIGGAFDRHTGEDPFALPKSWLDAKAKLDAATPYNFVTTNDIIGGNSGSPVINKDLEVVGLIFDGNIESLGGDYGFDAAVNRAVAVDTRAILEALDKVYGAQALAAELAGKKPNG